MKINGKEIKIKRENAHVSEVDKAYCNLLQQILDEGLRTHNRTGIDTISIAGWNYKFDLQKGFPILETKKVNAKKFSSEIQWIHQVQSNRVAWLNERDNDIWDLWAVDDDGIYRRYEQGENAIDDPERVVPLLRQVIDPITGLLEKIPMVDKYNNPIMVKSLDVMNEKPDARTISEAIWFGPEYAGTIGEAYGYINSVYKRPQCVENTLKTNPEDRRMNISLWQDKHLVKAVLPSCVWSSEYKTTPDRKLHAYIHQRSADVPVGVPFNFPQYALLLSMFAKATGYKVGTMSWSIMDAHIYVDQIEGIKKQLKRYEYMEKYGNIIQSSTDEELETLYQKMQELDEKLYTRAKILLTENIDQLTMAKRFKELEKIDKNLAKEYQDNYESKLCFEHMLTREDPVLELAEHDSIFKYSTDYVPDKDPYLKENPIGNKEIVLRRYHPTPFIKMPVAQ